MAPAPPEEAELGQEEDGEQQGQGPEGVALLRAVFPGRVLRIQRQAGAAAAAAEEGAPTTESDPPGVQPDPDPEADDDQGGP